MSFVCDRKVACPLSPWRKLNAKDSQLERHLEEDHSAPRFYIASGKKQMKVIMSLYEADLFTGRVPGRYLVRSSELFRQQVTDVVPTNRTTVDWWIRVVLDGGHATAREDHEGCR